MKNSSPPEDVHLLKATAFSRDLSLLDVKEGAIAETTQFMLFALHCRCFHYGVHEAAGLCVKKRVGHVPLLIQPFAWASNWLGASESELETTAEMPAALASFSTIQRYS